MSDQPTASDKPTATGGDKKSPVIKLLLLAAVLGVFAYLFVAHREELTLAGVAKRESQFEAFRQKHPVAVFAVAFGVYVVVTGLSLPGAAVLTLFYGRFFGFWPSLVLVSFASTTGATIAFLLSRYLLRDTIKNRFAERVEKFDAALKRDGPFYLFTLRLIPAVPFFVINLVMGLTPIRVTTYWWVSQFGMIPGTCVYVYAGTQIPSAAALAQHGLSGILTWQLGLAFTLLGAFPFITKKLLERWGPKKVQEALDEEREER